MNINLLLLIYSAIYFHHTNAQSCSASTPCATKACCSQWGNCGFGTDFCGTGCLHDCDATSECGEFAKPGEEICPLNVCCSQWGFCGTTSEFCNESCQNGCGGPSMPSGGGNGNIVAGYYASWASTRQCDAWTTSEINPKMYTHLFYAFADVRGGVMATPSSSQSTDMLAFTALKSQNPSLKCLVSIGGWAFNDPGPTQSEFHNIAASVSSRSAFIGSVQGFLSTYGFDGIDIDWEYPVAEERGGFPEDKNNYVLLIQEMRQAFGSNYLITIAAPASYWYLRHFRIGQMSNDLDFINLMTYDFHGVWNQNNVLGTALRSHTDIRMIREALDLCARDTVLAGKIVLGIGYYGRSYTLASSSCNTIETCHFSGPGQPGPCTNAAGVLSWNEIQNIATTKGLTPILDTASMSKYLYWDNQWVSYDDDETLEYRRNFAKSNGLGGFMVWSIDQGTTNSQIAPLHDGEMKWYQCVQNVGKCCQRTSVFCLECDVCYMRDVQGLSKYFSKDSEPDVRFTNWMGQLSDDLKLTEMSIPGTHDSAAIDVHFRAELFARCQSMTITLQLEAGIRVFDCRCRHINNVFAMHHGDVFVRLAFGDVLTMICDFLRSNPTEMIIMRIKQEYEPENVSRSFQDTLEEYLSDPNYSDFIDRSTVWTTLGAYRGKILITNDHDCENFGQFGKCWSDAIIQDQYQIPGIDGWVLTDAVEYKMGYVTEALDAAKDDYNRIHINFISASSTPILNPIEVAGGSPFNVEGVNDKFGSLLRAESGDPTAYKKTGIVMMDFPGPSLIYEILMRN